MNNAGLAVFRSLFRVPGARRPIVGALIGRVPIGMGSLSVILLVRESTGNYGAAGIVGFATVVAGAVATPFFGRLIDRHGQPAVLMPGAVANVVFMAALVVCAVAQLGLASLVICGFLIGATNPPLSAAMRSLWARLLANDPRLSSAYALEAIFQEAYFVVGPLIVAAFVALANAATAVIAATICALVGTIVFATSEASRAWRPDAATAGVARMGALSRPGVRTMLGVTVFQAAAFGAVYVAMPAFAEGEGNRAASGVLLACLAGGSLFAGLIYGSRSWRASATRRYLIFSVLFGLGLAPLVFANTLTGMGELMFIAGLSLAPVGASGYLLVRELTPPEALTEAFSWGSTAQAAGSAIGFGIGGQLIDRAGVGSVLVLACLCALGGAAVALSFRRTLEPGQVPGPGARVGETAPARSPV